MQCRMSNNSISTYKFKPFQFTVLKKNLDPQQRPEVRFGLRVVCNSEYLFMFGKAETKYDAFGQRVPPTMQVLWKYCFDLGEWKVIKCPNVPQILPFSTVTLSGNIIIIYDGTRVSSGGFCGNRIYLGNLANEYKENGMSFVNLEESGDVPFQLFGLGVVMDGKYIYSINGSYGLKNQMNIQQFDLSTKKWDLLHKSEREIKVPRPRCHHEVVLYKRRIYILGGGPCSPQSSYGFSKIYTFDVATKQWTLLPAKQDHRVQEPGYPIRRFWHNCAQCPKKSNLVYLCGGYYDENVYDILLNDVWRIDLDTLQWEKLTNCMMPRPVFFHSTAITPSGRMICYTRVLSEDRSSASDNITSAWIKIPKLKVICWEAMVYYFKEQMFESSDECLKKIGIPPKYYERIIKERRIC